MVFCRARPRGRIAPDGIGVNVGCTIHPSPAPRMVIDEHHVMAPIEVGPPESPSPGTKRQANGYAKAEADRGAHDEAGARSRKHDARAIRGDHDETRVYGHDGDVGPAPTSTVVFDRR